MGLLIALESAAQTGAYEATVTLSANTERGRAEAFAEAMRQVLVQATGRAGAPDEPGLAPLVRDAARYVQQYRTVPGGLMYVGFDARRIEGLISAADPSQVSQIRIAIEGVENVGAYAEVTAYLESLMQLRQVQVDELRGETVVYRAQMRGDTEKVAQAIGQNSRLHRESDAAAEGASAELRYRYSP